MLVTKWINGCWNDFDVETLAEAKKLVVDHDSNWAIYPSGLGSTWMIAIVNGQRVGAHELWQEFDAIVPSVIDDNECDDRQRKAIAFVRNHYHACHGLSDGSVRIGVSSSFDDGGEHTELIVVEPIRSELRDALGY